MTPEFTQVGLAVLTAGALAATWWIVDGRSLVVYPLINCYLDFRFWLTERRMWIRETKRWASTLTAEIRAVRTTAVLRHHLSTRPRHGSPEWRTFSLHLQQRADWARNNWRDGRPPVQPEPHFPPWMLSYSGFTFWRENPPQLGKDERFQ